MKIFIVAPEYIVDNKVSVAQALVSMDDDLNICRTFTSQKNVETSLGEYLYYLDIDDIVLSFKNNALLFIDYNDQNITGVTLDDFDASDVVIINPGHFNAVADVVLNGIDTLVVWLDTNYCDNKQSKKVCLSEYKYLLERVETLNLPLLYFNIDMQDTESISQTILEYINADSKRRTELIEENT